MEDPESSARASLRRSTFIYGLMLAADVLVLGFIAVNRAGGGAYVSLTVVGLVGLLLCYYVVQHVRDLGGTLAESEGVVTRKWTRADLIIAMQSYYITVERTIFRVRAEDHLHIEPGMYVKVVHFPHTLNVVTIHQIAAPPRDGVP